MTLRSRRLVTAIALAVAGMPARGGVPDADRPTWEAIDLGGLNAITSQGGVLSATLHAAPANIMVGDARFPGATYNGQYAGPVLRVRPGDMVRLILENQLTEPTNLHFHGLRVTPLDHGDNMHIVVPPGTTTQYAFRIPPGHPPGLFWFHDHLHGMTDKHVMAGLSGTILIDGFARQFTGMSHVPQKLLVLKDFSAPECSDPILKISYHCRVVSINGLPQWHDAMAQGESHIWRIANEGADFTLHLSVPGLAMRIIGRDGMPTVHAEDATVLDVMPASRLDVLVTATQSAHFSVAALHVPTGTGSQFSANRIMGSVDVVSRTGQQEATVLSFPAQTDLRQTPLDARRIVTFTETADATRYFIDGKTFDHDRVDIRVPLGHVEEWTVRNQTQDFHEFHIHQIGFQVVEVNGVKQDFAGFVDDVRVPEMGEVKLIMPFTDPVIVGRFMFHCHVLKHEDAGMMATIEVFRPGHATTLPICRIPPQPAPS